MGESNIGERIFILLKHNNLKQRELAKLANISEVSLSRYISNKRIPKGPVIADIASALGTTTDYLLGKQNDNASEEAYIQIQRLISQNVHLFTDRQKNEIICALFQINK